MKQKTSLAQKKLVHTAILLTFIIRYKCRLKKHYFRQKKNLKKTNTPLRVVKNQEKASNIPAIPVRLLIKGDDFL